MTTDPKAPLPSQIPFIIGNEACERFSFYGMRNILVKFLTSTMLLGYVPDKELRELEAKDIFHTFVMGVYFFPLLGGWLSDRFFGKFNTILWFSLIYCAGQGCLAFFVDDRHGFYAGLFLIALGSGGIKPLVASFVGDQFDQSNKHRAKVVFDAFYWSINFGSFFASLLMPYFLRSYGPTVAFGIPGALMFVATVIFVLGAPRYVRVPPAPPDPSSFFRVSLSALFSGGAGSKGAIIAMCGLALAGSSLLLLFWLDLIKVLCIVLVIAIAFFSAGVSSQLERARGKHPDEAVDGVRAVLRILIVFALITPFWSLFDQKASTWVLQGNHMAQPTWFESSQMQLVNPALVMLLIPLNNLVVFPWLRKRGWPLTALGKMTVGMALAGVSFAIAGFIQLGMDRAPLQIDVTGASAQISTEKVWIYLQIIPYVFLTLGEVLVSATGLEFAYSQAPKSMKGVIMSFFNLTVTIGGLWTLLANESIQRKSVVSAIEDTGIGTNVFFLFFFALFALVAAYGFRVYARRYKVVDNYLHSPPVAPVAQVPKATAREKPDKQP